MPYQYEKQQRRDNKRKKNRYGHVVDSRSVFEIARQQQERAEAIKRKKRRKLEEADEEAAI